VTIEAHTDGRARAAESVQAAFTGSEQSISFNPAYLLDGLTAAAICGTAARPQPGDGAAAAEPEPGRIRLQFTSPAKPALITWAGYEAELERAVTEREAAEQAAAQTARHQEARHQEAGDQEAGEPATGDRDAAGAAAAAPGDGTLGDGTPAFRYLVVPQRSTTGPVPGRG
jgi:DNA polymerase III beta subunit, C-terminal domain